MTLRLLVVLLLVAAGAAPAQAPSTADTSRQPQRSARHAFRIVTVVDSVYFPSALAWLPNGDLLLTERPGRLRVVRDGVLDPTPIAGVPAVWRARGQGGLLDIALHPDFARNGLLYLSHGMGREGDSSGTLAVTRARLEGDRLVEAKAIFVANAWEGRNNHFGGRLAFDAKGFLYVTVGERMADPNLLAAHPAQDPRRHFGTVVRLHDDGRVPSDNPFRGRGDTLPEIWSYGHRNPQGIAVDPASGDVWETEHGPRGGDELNLIRRGGNYGWPMVTWGVNYDGTPITAESRRAGMESPRFTWVPSIATAGMTFYTGDRFAWWKGNLFIASLAGQQLVRVTIEDGRVVSTEPLLQGVVGRMRDVRQGPDGLLYLVLESGYTSTRPSRVVRLEPVESEVKGPIGRH
ncbi:MAG TPA: PQQ-dependent sugar dehydrogenase, partial [Gemmatimonadaceae bacterium]|nr:PQQ-dependent sugar dehydrogenase [Gemmatimonadaceae bacterium]